MDIEIISSGTIKTDGSYHGWPSVAVTNDGKLLAAASGNRECHICPMGRVRLYTSSDFGNSWDEGVQLSTGPLDDRDAGLCAAQNNVVLLSYFTSTYALMTPKESDPPHWNALRNSITVSTINKEHGFWMLRSHDNGKTWSEKYPVPVNNPHGPSLLSSGDLFFAGVEISSSPATQSNGARSSGKPVGAVSRDNGETWQIISDIPTPPGQEKSKLLELHSVEAPDGRIIVHIRNHNTTPASTWQTQSADGGVSWSQPRFICNGFPSHLAKLSGSRLIMSYSRRESGCGVRARISSDCGENWSSEIILYDQGICRDLGYPSTVELPDGSLFTLWYENVTGKEAGFSVHTPSKAVLKYLRWKL